MTPIDSTSGSTTPVAMVAATTVPNTRNATKLKKAAHITARRGVSTRVDTTVAIELAASWKPLTKSNARAMAMTMTTAASSMDGGGGAAQACLRAIASTTSEMSSIVSRACSIVSTTSFQYSVARALNSTE